MGVTQWRSLPKIGTDDRARDARDANTPGHGAQAPDRNDAGSGEAGGEAPAEEAAIPSASVVAAPATEHELGRGKRRKRPSRRALEAAD